MGEVGWVPAAEGDGRRGFQVTTEPWERVRDVDAWRATRTRGKAGHARRTYARKKNATVGFPWEVCRACGLVRLKNAASEKAARGACDAKEAV